MSWALLYQNNNAAIVWSVIGTAVLTGLRLVVLCLSLSLSFYLYLNLSPCHSLCLNGAWQRKQPVAMCHLNWSQAKELPAWLPSCQVAQLPDLVLRLRLGIRFLMACHYYEQQPRQVLQMLQANVTSN
ncbi:hypothetical protein ACLKA6_012265 [Drosophila palustris]